jgi:hypothetical protein
LSSNESSGSLSSDESSGSLSSNEYLQLFKGHLRAVFIIFQGQSESSISNFLRAFSEYYL